MAKSLIEKLFLLHLGVFIFILSSVILDWLSMCSVYFLRVLLLLKVLEHLVLVVVLMLPLLEPVVELRRDDRSAIILLRLALVDYVEIGFQLPDKFDVGIFVVLIDLAVHDSDTLFVVPSDTLQQLEPLAPGHA
jgi:hypothetical protein